MVKLNLQIIITTIEFGFIFIIAESMRFDMNSGQIKCISDDINRNSMTAGKYSVVNPNEGYPLPGSHKLAHVQVILPHGSTYHQGNHIDSGNFAFVADEDGVCSTCFRASEHSPEITVTVDFEWKAGVAAKDWSNVAKKGQIEVTSIQDEMFYLREREEEMQEPNRSTNSNMASLSLLSLVVCFSVAGLQLWYLKTYFERKKLLEYCIDIIYC